MKRRIISVLLAVVMLLALTVPAFALEGDIVVFYTNDVHTYINNAADDEPGITYSMVAALKQSQPNSVLVDAGDHIQGTAYGSMDDGKTITELMNATGYDVATLGNHEFDYGMETCLATTEASFFPYTSCNFYHEQDGIVGSTVLSPYVIVETDGVNIAFVGITTPETFTSSTPAYFQNKDGEYIYGIAGGDDGEALYAAVQTAVDEAKENGADYVIALGHLGVDASSSPWTSRDVIAHTSGLDAFIDGHSHTTMSGELVTNKDGKEIPLTQTGSYLNAVGMMTISASGQVVTELLTAEDFADLTPDEDVKAIEDEWISEIDEQLGTVIGYSEVTLDNFDKDGNRLVRTQSTNTGDFAADALYYLFDEVGMDVDAAIMNGGGIRNKAITGEISYLTCKEIHTFGNVACLQTVTGQQILDALEWGARELSPDETIENGGFLHVSGMKYTIDTTIPSTVQMDEKGVWIGGATGEYRVRDVQIWDREKQEYVALDVTKKYNLAGYNYTLRDLGDGFAMFDDAVNVLDYVSEDYMVLANYVQSFPVDEESGLPTITAESGYSDVNGSGRITILTESEDETPAEKPVTKPEQKPEQTVISHMVLPGDSLWGIAKKYYGSGTEWRKIYNANKGQIQDPNMIWPGQVFTIPA